MFRIDLSRRLSEFVGVLLFALALVWLIALATYSPADAVWFFNSGGVTPPLNLVGMAGSFLSEASYQVLGIASYLFPPMLAVVGWFAFWCRPIGAAYTKLIGLALMVACVTSLLDLALGTVDVAGKSFLAGGYAGYGIAARSHVPIEPHGRVHPRRHGAGAVGHPGHPVLVQPILLADRPAGRAHVRARRALVDRPPRTARRQRRTARRKAARARKGAGVRAKRRRRNRRRQPSASPGPPPRKTGRRTTRRKRCWPICRCGRRTPSRASCSSIRRSRRPARFAFEKDDLPAVPVSDVVGGRLHERARRVAVRSSG